MDKVRYVKLKNSGGFVAQIEIKYRKKVTDASGNVSYETKWRKWRSSSYSDICIHAERTVDLCADAKLPEGTPFKLKAIVALGKSKESEEQYEVAQNGSLVTYERSGTTLFNTLKLK